jgi:hypothetical protein
MDFNQLDYAIWNRLVMAMKKIIKNKRTLKLKLTEQMMRDFLVTYIMTRFKEGKQIHMEDKGFEALIKIKSGKLK